VVSTFEFRQKLDGTYSIIGYSPRIIWSWQLVFAVLDEPIVAVENTRSRRHEHGIGEYESEDSSAALDDAAGT
jgi:hypothetical protein